MFLGDIEKRALGCYGLKSSFDILLCDTYDRTLIDYVEFLKDTLNTFYTSNIHEIDNAIHCTWKRWSKYCWRKYYSLLFQNILLLDLKLNTSFRK